MPGPNLDCETEEGRANWARFCTTTMALAQQDDLIAVHVAEAARLNGITDGVAIHRMIEACKDAGARLMNVVTPFLPKESA